MFHLSERLKASALKNIHYLMLTVKYTPNTPIKIKASCGSVQTKYISKLVSKVSNVPKKNLNPQKGNFIYFLSEYSKY